MHFTPFNFIPIARFRIKRAELSRDLSFLVAKREFSLRGFSSLCLRTTEKSTNDTGRRHRTQENLLSDIFAKFKNKISIPVFSCCGSISLPSVFKPVANLCRCETGCLR